MSTPTYHLWLVPAGEPQHALAAVISTLARELGAPVFEPHVTLLANLGDAEHEHLRRAEELAGRLQPTRIVLSEPSYTDEFFQCLFMKVEPTPEVVRLRATAAAVFGRDPQPYMPHLSLVYGSFAPSLKRAVIRRLPPEARTSFVAETLHVIKADSTAPEDWHEIARFPFNADPGGPRSPIGVGQVKG